MSQYSVSALYGDDANTSEIPADMMNQFAASGATDWNAILANGIRGAAQAGIAASVNEKFNDGQLVRPPVANTATNKNTTMLLMVGLAYLVLR
ncbi:hypothetical protein [Duganella sp. BJB476]|uniref:hypothetical protein n=1 Tax=Duganella sp. BJB476 TaxID=1871176 RepID=UPI000E35725F|nr:hypothetical protein [Duganella sp. BJB476]RFP36153.1 hypothetical protein D0T21_06885 [Duganella sp. BJB476]